MRQKANFNDTLFKKIVDDFRMCDTTVSHENIEANHDCAEMHILAGFGHLTRKLRDSEMMYKTSQRQYSTCHVTDAVCDI